MVAGNGDTTDQEFMSSPLKEDSMLSYIPHFVAHSHEKPSTWPLTEYMSGSQSLKLTKSRSCKASLMTSPYSPWFEKEETNDNEHTPPTGFEKEFTGRPEDIRRRLYELNYGANIERLSRKGSQSSIRSVAAIDLEAHRGRTSTDDNITSVNTCIVRMEEKAELQQEKQVADNPVHESELKAKESLKNVKDVGLDPIEDDSKSPSNWPSEFKRLQKEIIELWDVCNVSLVHRTYFFLLFKGDPTDSIYMEVELRRLSFLKDTFSRGSKTIEEGQTLLPASSMKALCREREMLRRQMKKRFSEQDRESLYLKWGIKINSKNRRSQLTSRLWTNTEDMHHVADSAFIVSKLAGIIEPGRVPKEMFGLNFAPQTPSRRSYSLKQSILSLL